MGWDKDPNHLPKFHLNKELSSHQETGMRQEQQGKEWLLCDNLNPNSEHNQLDN